MSANKVKLTQKTVEQFKCPPDKPQAILWDADIRGFGLRAMPDRVVDGVVKLGVKSYVFQGRVKGTGEEVRITLGRADELPLKGQDDHADEKHHGARKRAETTRAMLALGRNPVKERVQAQAADKVEAERVRVEAKTLDQVAEHYIANRVTAHGPLKAKSVADIRRHIAKAFAAWKDMPVKDITRDMCEQRYKELRDGGLYGKRPGPAQAGQAFAILRALLSWAREKFRVDGKPIIDENPVQVLKGQIRPAKPRTRRVPIERVGHVWAALRERRRDDDRTYADHTGADLAMFLLLTGSRIGEASALTWDRVELGEKAGVWHLPDPKNSNPVWLPLSAAARELLTGRKPKPGSNFVFPARVGDGHMLDARGPLEVVTKAAEQARISAHDLRRTFTQIGLHLGIELWKLELLTNHVPKSVTLVHYVERSDLRYLAAEVEKIGAFIVQQGAIAAAGNVVRLRA